MWAALLFFFNSKEDKRIGDGVALHAVAPDANNRHGEADTGDGGLHQLVLHKGLDLAADLLAVDLLLVQLLAASGTLVAVRVAEDLVAGLHPSRGSLVLPGLSRSGSPLGGRRQARCGRSEDVRGDEARQTSAEAEERGVQEVRMPESAGGEGEGKEECRSGHTGHGVEVSGRRRGEGTESLGGSRCGGELEERRDCECRKSI